MTPLAKRTSRKALISSLSLIVTVRLSAKPLMVIEFQPSTALGGV